MRRALLALALLGPAWGATKLAVTVVEQRTCQPVTDLQAADFTVLDDRTPRRVEGVERSSGLMDVMLLLDTSLLGEMVQPVAGSLIPQLQDKDQMAVVAFHSSADLIQDFTSSQELLRRAVAGVKFGNVPRVLDALYAAIDGGFRSSGFRRVIILLSAGVEGSSRVSERDVLRLARRNGVSIYPVYVVGAERTLFEMLARQTGGATFNLRELRRHVQGPPGPRVFEVLRSYYTLSVAGNLSLGERIKVQVSRPGKFTVSWLPLE
ncbi:MAG: VWA domain-containing protein [Acidobacteria bacterium]|nr:VWA domain-containing protein [Acidobacteriota bacterium]